MNNLRIIGTKRNNLRIMNIKLSLCLTLTCQSGPVLLVELHLFNPHLRLQSVFFLSLLVHLASSMQESSLEDYVQLSVMMQYNYRESKTVSE